MHLSRRGRTACDPPPLCGRPLPCRGEVSMDCRFPVGVGPAPTRRLPISRRGGWQSARTVDFGHCRAGGRCRGDGDVDCPVGATLRALRASRSCHRKPVPGRPGGSRPKQPFDEADSIGKISFVGVTTPRVAIWRPSVPGRAVTEGCRLPASVDAHIDPPPH